MDSPYLRMGLEDERNVAKVTRERIYGIAMHPSPSRVLVGAGDKAGNLGLWSVDDVAKEEDDGYGKEIETTEEDGNRHGELSIVCSVCVCVCVCVCVVNTARHVYSY